MIQVSNSGFQKSPVERFRLGAYRMDSIDTLENIVTGRKKTCVLAKGGKFRGNGPILGGLRPRARRPDS
jgi:hypothetical protein